MKKTLTLILLLFSSVIINAEENNFDTKRLTKPFVLSSNNFDGNRIDCDIQNNGMFVSHVVSGRSGLSWPKGYGTQTIFASGLWLGGIVNGEVRVVAGEFAGEFASGPWGKNHDSELHKIYKVNKSDLSYPQNYPDFQNWPTDLGAPWVDNNNNGTYEPLPEGPDHPEFIGDQVLWMVMNDGVDSLHWVFHSPPMGFEVQRTVFGFDRADEYGDIMFVKDLIINKGENEVREMFIGLWSDPDLGDASDDFVGCDTVLGLGICYNDGDDVNFTAPWGGGSGLGMTPAVGYDYFQGPMVPALSETAKMFGREIPDMKNLKMTSFIKYIGSDPKYYDPNNALEAYYYLNGWLPDGSDFPFIASGGTKFIHPGDPTKDTGLNDTEYVDKDLHPSDDRRFLMSSGPFTMAPGDSQEVVYAIINAADGTWDQSYLKLKEVDIMAQRAYDGDFKSGDPPSAPNVEVTELEDQFIITWENNAESYSSEDLVDLNPDTEKTTEYKFEGYNVYQVENADGSGESIKIATYDLINDVTVIMDDVFDSNYGVNVNVPVQKGSDSGIKRSIKIDEDHLNNASLKINREYYFAVTAYGYNEYGKPKTLESMKRNTLIVRPQIPNRWQPHNEVVYNWILKAEHIAGNGNGSAFYKVIDPTKITGDDYEITFNEEIIIGNETYQITNWNLTNISTDEILLSDQTIINGIDQITGVEVGEDANPIAEGLQFIVNGPALTMKSVGVYANVAGPIDPPVDGLPWWRYPDWLVADGNYDNQQTNGSIWHFNTHPGYGPGGPETFLNSVVVYSGGLNSLNQGMAALVPDDFEFRFTGNGRFFDNWGDGWFSQPAPFEVWNIGSGTPDDPSDDYKLITWLLDDDGSGDWGLTPNDHETSGGDNDPYTDRVYVHAPTDDTPGTQGHDNWWANITQGAQASWVAAPGDNDAGGPLDTWNVFSRTVLMNWNGGSVADPTFPHNVNALEPETGTVWRFVTTKPNTEADVFFFSTDTLTGKIVEYDPDNIKVWPNPYFGYNPEEAHMFDRQIHFTHLPETGKCIIRIFDLAGTLVRKIVHDNGTQFEIWDLANDKNIYVASGMYIVHIETEEGEKILKLAVIQPS